MGRVGDRVAVRVGKPLRKPRTTFAMFEKADETTNPIGGTVSYHYGFLVETMVSILLLLTILYCVRLNKQLRLLKADEQSLRATISELDHRHRNRRARHRRPEVDDAGRRARLERALAARRAIFRRTRSPSYRRQSIVGTARAHRRRSTRRPKLAAAGRQSGRCRRAGFRRSHTRLGWVARPHDPHAARCAAYSDRAVCHDLSARAQGFRLGIRRRLYARRADAGALQDRLTGHDGRKRAGISAGSCRRRKGRLDPAAQSSRPGRRQMFRLQ